MRAVKLVYCTTAVEWQTLIIMTKFQKPNVVQCDATLSVTVCQ